MEEMTYKETKIFKTGVWFGVIALLALGAVSVNACIPKAHALADSLNKVQVVQKTCSETASRIVAAGTAGQAFKFTNEGTAQDGVGDNEVFLGGSDVNVTTKGYRYEAGENDAFDIGPTNVWCVTNTGETTVLTIFIGNKA